MRRILVVLIAALAGLVALIAVGYWSGKNPPLDEVAAARKALGVELRSSMVSTNGIALHVVEAGPADGPPVVLLHGYPEFWFGWKEQVARLAAAGFHVIVPDQRGYNTSDKPDGIEAYRIDALMRDVIGLLDHFGLEETALAGHDWGGAIAWNLVLEYPLRFRRLAMFNSPHPLAWREREEGAPKEESISWFRTFFQLPLLPELLAPAGNWWLTAKTLRDTARPGTFPDTEMQYYQSAWSRPGAARSMINWYRAAFRYPHNPSGDGLVRVPTRLIWGMQDRFFPSTMLQASARHCVNASVIELPDATHWLLHEEPERTSQAMIEFFKPS